MTAPTCWRSECRTGCYYPQACSAWPVTAPTPTPDTPTGWHRHQTQGVVRDVDCPCRHGIRNVPPPDTSTPNTLAGVEHDPTHGLNHAPLPEGTLLDPGFCAGCDALRAAPEPDEAAPEPDETQEPTP